MSKASDVYTLAECVAKYQRAYREAARRRETNAGASLSDINQAFAECRTYVRMLRELWVWWADNKELLTQLLGTDDELVAHQFITAAEALMGIEHGN